MAKYYCNPLNLEYRIQNEYREGIMRVYREAADPSLIQFKGLYYVFPSMSGGFWTSADLADWTFNVFRNAMPVTDYAPDVRAVGEYMYFCASKRHENCSFFRTKDPLTEPFEEIKGVFPFWDPDMFLDDDGKLYFYWGCSNQTPIYGCELDISTMTPKTERFELFDSDMEHRGYERVGDDHKGGTWYQRPYIEGPWMTKRAGKYYLQYAIPGTEFNVYGDGVYVSDKPLGPFKPARNNPYSYKPGGFMNGAGHGSTLCDKAGNYWHTSTMRISINHVFERRLGLWKAGFDSDGELYCDQRYGDWPVRLDAKPFEAPEMLLLSYKKPVKATSGTGAAFVTDENCRTWWRADADDKTPALTLDLEHVCNVRAVQLNFAEEGLPPKITADTVGRFIDPEKQRTRWLLEGSWDGKEWQTLCDKRNADTDLTHDFITLGDGMELRFLRLTVTGTAFSVPACVSGLRVFGIGPGPAPEKPQAVKAERLSGLDARVSWQRDGAFAHNILWGSAPDKLYHSYLVFDSDSKDIGALVSDETYCFRVDAINEAGITEGDVVNEIR